MDCGLLGLVCQTCGDEGFTNAYIYCVKCLRFVIHRYCLDVMPVTTDEFVPWFCEDCKPANLPLKHDPKRLHKEDHTIKISLVKTPKRKKIQKNRLSKKRKIVPFIAEMRDKVCYPDEEALGSDHECVSGTNQIKSNVVLGLDKEAAGPDYKCVSGPNQIKNNVVSGSENEAAGPDHECVSGPNQIKRNLVLGLEKGVFQKQSLISTQLSNCPLRKHESLLSQKENLAKSLHVKTTKNKKKRENRQIKNVSLVAVGEDKVSTLEQVTKPNREDTDQITPCADNGVLQKQSCESQNQASAIPENEPLQSQKENVTTNSAQLETINSTTSSAQLETTKPKKKQKKEQKKQKKKKKSVSLVASPDEEVTKPNHECIALTNSPHKVTSDSEPNQITLCVSEKVVFQQQDSSKSAELDNNCCPVDESVKRTSDATSVDLRPKKPETGNSMAEHSSCESSCTNNPLKHSVAEQEQEQDQKCELKQFNVVDQVLHSSSIEELSNQPTETETENRMHQEQGAYASQSAYLENNVHTIHYQPARPIIDPLWRGSFNIVQTDYNVFEGFVGHLSSKACARVRDEALTLPSLLCLEMLPKTALWPKSFLESPPSDDNIALYFLPGSIRNKRDFERLVSDMIFEEFAMKVTTKNAELLIFTSKVLPEQYWTFHGRYYLWGVFRRKKNEDNGLAAPNTSDNRGLSSYQVTSEKEISQL